MSVSDIDAVDAQVHVWGANTPERPWDPRYAGAAHGPKEWTAEVVVEDMDRAGVAAAIIVPPSFEGDRNDLGLSACYEYPHRFRMHGRFAIDDPGQGRRICEEYNDPGMIGVRLTFNAAAADWLDTGAVEWFWGMASEQDIRVSLFPVGRQLQQVAAIARRYSKLRISIDHLGAGAPGQPLDSLGRIKELEVLSGLTNVAVKASALPISFPATYSPESVRLIIDLLLDWFGPSRIFWGSDYTRMSDPGEYGKSLEVFRRGISHLARAEEELILGLALREWFDW